MKDALGQELRLGQRVAVPCNSRFKIGILYNYRENRSKWYREVADGVANNIPTDGMNRWRVQYYNLEWVNAHSHKYYIRFEDGRTRTMTERASIIGVSDDAEITV